jgi:uncharacterized phiE125 gp8 family phage protein
MGAITRAAIVADSFALDAAKTYLRIDGETEDSAVTALLVTAMEQCEAFTGLALIRRAMTETLSPGGAWQLLTPEPVRAVTNVQGLALDGSTVALNASAYEIDIDADGRGRVRFLAPIVQSRAVVTVEAGLAVNWAGLPESLRQGVVRLVAHYHVHRERADELGPPAAVAALWRGFRRVRL